jgi:hypothetical protein
MGGSGGGSGEKSRNVAQYAELRYHAGRGSLYVYVVVAPPSYEQAHTTTGVLQ